MVLSFSLHSLVHIFFVSLILCLVARLILSWVVSFSLMSPGNPVFRFFNRVTDPILNPVASRIPRMAVFAFDIGLMIAFIFAWWSLALLDALLQASLPGNW
jgi:YggT family protein